MVSMGVVGLGYWGPNLARNIASSPGMELAILCDMDPDRLEVIGSRFPSARQVQAIEDVISDPEIDAVAVATPVTTHFALAQPALEAGKHVLVEKPLAATAEEARVLVELSRERNRVLMVDHVFLFSPAVRRLIEIYRSGDLGKVNFIDSVRINLGLIQSDVNVVWDLAPHDLSIIDGLLGRTPVSVTAVGRSHVANGTVDAAYLHLDYGDVTAAVHLNWLSPVKIRHLLVGGTKKSVLYNDLNSAEPLKVYDSGVNVANEPSTRRGLLVSYRSGDVLSPKVESYEPLAAMIGHFAECIETGIEPLTGGHQGLRIVRLLEAADRSLVNEGTPVAVET